MTKKLYYDALYQRYFDAAILSQEERQGKIWVLLNQTLFYPGGGGQPCDLGTLNDIAVEDVFEMDGNIYHVLNQKLQDEGVHGRIDWDRRFELMQQHLGQHILSAVFVRDYERNTVGLRLERDSLSIDLDGYVKEETLALAEKVANEIIYQNIPVEVLYPTMEEIRENSKRPIPDTADSIRIIKIGDLDYTPCCGLQNKTTGEVGIIKIQRSSTHKNGTRIHFLCGRPAMEWLSEIQKSCSFIQSTLRCSEEELPERISKLHRETQELKTKNLALLTRMAAADAKQLLSDAVIVSDIAVVSHILPDTTQEEMKLLYTELTKEKGIVVLLGGNTPEGASLMFGCNKAEKKVDVWEAFQTAIALLEGRGGGGPSHAQGVGSNIAALPKAMETANEIIKEKI